MLPILLCSVVVGAICLERWWTLRRVEVIPPVLLSQLQSTKEWSSDNKALAELAVDPSSSFLMSSNVIESSSEVRIVATVVDRLAQMRLEVDSIKHHFGESCSRGQLVTHLSSCQGRSSSSH